MEKLFFEMAREHRGKYLAEYTPPKPGQNSASLFLTYLVPASPDQIVAELFHETKTWIDLYPVPLMSSAWDNNDEQIILPEGRYLCAWPEQSKINFSWDLKISDLEKHKYDLRQIYGGKIPFRTEADVSRDVALKVRKAIIQNRIGKAVLVGWVLSPIILGLVEIYGPGWITWLAFSFVVWKAVSSSLKLLGWIQVTPKERLQSELEFKKNHYFYHCERNPAGFARLKSENFREDDQKKVLEEARKLQKR